MFLVSAKGHGLENGALRDPVFATDFGRYEFRPKGDQKVIFPYAIEDDARLLSEEELRKRWPKTYQYMKLHEAKLRKRKQFKAWYGYSAPRSLKAHEGAHLVIPLLADRGLAAFLPEARRRSLCPMAGGGFTITVAEEAGVSPLLVLGLLNSRLLFWCLRARSNVFRGGWITCTKQYVGEPISCWCPAHFTDSHVEFTNSVCWVSTYYTNSFMNRSAIDSNMKKHSNSVYM